ncbi:hypothetical protein [Mannheimia varigena]|uniref:hypothetical protein n=1 Tax=Mannheimia varigena TaxID=85404 RepID=UPI0015B6DC1F|nr:hypothetical protein [Mannheimia varigena]QLD33180.1 hypothetical protein A6B42_05105 [Mannheimia varigena]
MAKKSYDWVSIKLEFVKSTLSIRDFAEAYGIPHSTLLKRAAAEKWSDERNQIGIRLESKAVEKVTDDKSDELAQFERKSLKAISQTHDKLLAILDMAKKPSELKAVSSALVDLQKVYRLALGASTENQATTEGFDRESWLKKLSEYEQGTDK